MQTLNSLAVYFEADPASPRGAARLDPEVRTSEVNKYPAQCGDLYDSLPGSIAVQMDMGADEEAG